MTSNGRDVTGSNILLIEDNPGDVMMVRAALSRHEVTANLIVISDGERAIERVEEIEAEQEPLPGLIILDLNLPKLTGMTVLRRIRDSVQWNRTPVVILTSSNSSADRHEADRLGANIYIRKPNGFDEFMDVGKVLKGFLG